MSETAAEAANKPYLVVSIADHKIWFKQGKEVLFEAGVATGSGKELVSGGSPVALRNAARASSVQEKEEDPAWVPPDWHFMEIANKRGLGVVELGSGQTISTGDGVITTKGGEVVKRYGDGRTVSLGGGTEGREIISRRKHHHSPVRDDRPPVPGGARDPQAQDGRRLRRSTGPTSPKRSASPSVMDVCACATRISRGSIRWSLWAPQSISIN